MSHQACAVAKLLPLKVGALFMEMGTGKTLTSIELAKLRQDKIQRVVWFCPVSVKYTIANEVKKHTTLTDDDILVFDDKTNHLTKGLYHKQFVIIGIESMSASDRVVYATQDLIDEKTMVVLDESTYIKNHRAKRTKRIEIISRKARYRVILTGTFMSQGAVDLFSQMNFLSPKILNYVSFYEFSERHLVYDYIKAPNGSKIKTNRIINELETELLAEKIAPYSYQVTKAECLDLPEKVYTSYGFELSQEQRLAYDHAKQLFIERLLEQGGDMYQNRIPIFQLFSDLQSISCGFWRYNNTLIEYEHGRIDAMLRAVGGIAPNEKVIIWGKYHYCIEQIVNALHDEYGDVVYQYHGKMSEKQRSQSLTDWSKKGRFMVATQSAGGHGLNELVSAHHVIFYANSFKYSERLQAEDRTHRIGQSQTCWYADIYAYDSIDDRIDKNLATKGGTLRIFMEHLESLRNRGLNDELIQMIQDL